MASINATPLVGQDFGGLWGLLTRPRPFVAATTPTTTTPTTAAPATVIPTATTPTVVAPTATPPAIELVNTQGKTVQYSGLDPRFMDNYAVAKRQEADTRAAVQAAQNAAASSVAPIATVAPVTVPTPTPIQASPSITSAYNIPASRTMPRLVSSSTGVMVTPFQNVTAGDAGAAIDATAQRYAQLAASGQVPVLNNLQAAYLNRVLAQGNLALSAATNSANTNAAYRALNDPDTRNRAQAIASTQGVSFDTAVKMALAGTLTEQGNYALANRYEGSTLLPAMEAENARQKALALEMGADAPALRDFMGNSYNAVNSPNSIYETGDGQTVRVNTPSHTFTGTPNAAATMNRLMVSTAPISDAYAIRQAGATNALSAARNASSGIADRMKNTATALDSQLKRINEAAKIQADIQKANFENQVRLMTQRTQTQPYTRTDTPAQRINALTNIIRALPEDDPQRQTIAREILKQQGFTVDDME